MVCKERHVVPTSDGGWNVKKPHADKASVDTNTKAESVGRTPEICIEAGAESIIYGRHGKI